MRDNLHIKSYHFNIVNENEHIISLSRAKSFSICDTVRLPLSELQPDNRLGHG
jgi:hypothetical protein